MPDKHHRPAHCLGGEVCGEEGEIKKKKNAPDQLKNKGCPCIQNYNYNSCCFGELLNILYMLVTFNKIKPIANGKKMLLC